ncbi:MAG: phenylalanine--tRNA ligase subunit alpha [Oscillospiraceae bacterium]|nr:phenylalanine--tRNA ligase subunit alpha [Oscillospiraceae bacterium]
MGGDLEKIRTEAKKEIESAKSLKELEELRVRYLGKKGEITSVLRGLALLADDVRPVIGNLVNSVRAELESSLNQKVLKIKGSELENSLKSESLDVTLPGKSRKTGTKHPLRTTLDAMKEIFVGMGFSVVSGPEIEWDVYNFDMLNIPKNHLARNESDTFFITDDLILRTQTSSVQARHMQLHKPPIRIISPGKVYRVDEIDSTHSPMFHQVEGLVVDKGVTMGNLKHTLETFFERFYGREIRIRFRPHNFQFTEPSAEVDISCFVCGGEGCRTCKNEGWIEALGCGMVHANVLSMCGIDPVEYSGFAFGFGLERIAMQKFEIDSLRLFFENDVRFLEQF